MFPTAEQADAIHELRQVYGPPSVKYEETSEPYGLVWMSWPRALSMGGGHDLDRNLFIRPNGERLAWEKQR